MATDDDGWDGTERRASEHLREVAESHINLFSIDVLDYNWRMPRQGQRRPGDTLREVEERMAANKARRARLERVAGALLLSFITVVMTATVAGIWPSVVGWIGGHH